MATTKTNSHQRATSISDWLINSGCTAHMSNCFDDFIGPVEPYETLVEAANGGVTRVSYKGKPKVYISDLFQPSHSALVTLHNVLYVPGLTRRLISVLEWNSCGGHVSFLTDRIRLEVFDQEGNTTASIEVPPVDSNQCTKNHQTYQRH
jgi:hypothetical protein